MRLKPVKWRIKAHEGEKRTLRLWSGMSRMPASRSCRFAFTAAFIWSTIAKYSSSACRVQYGKRTADCSEVQQGVAKCRSSDCITRVL